MKEYYVDMNITLSVRQWIEAETEEEAQDKALRNAVDNYSYMASQGLYVEAFVTDIIQNK
jgi:hypothetical protein